MKRNYYLTALLLVAFSLFAQEKKVDSYKIMFYNTENLFDCENDPHTNDDDFTPQGSYRWNYSRYSQKLENIAKVVTSIGGWEPPALIGLCEIENRGVLNDLTKKSSLKVMRYEIVHRESPDPRGIDVALLYKPDKFRVISEKFYQVKNPQTGSIRTREVLYAAGIIPNGDTLHVFVCHFPSRLGGEMESEDKRLAAAAVVRERVDSLFSVTADANIIIMGDFNDYPTNKSISEVIGAKPLTQNVSATDMYNLFYKYHNDGKIGTHKFGGEWGVLDQMIVSGNLLNKEKNIYTYQENIKIYDADFLLEDDRKFLGKKPFRTYIGFKFNGGFADHLPIIVTFDMVIKKRDY